MSSAYTLKISAEQAKEMPMVDLAFEVLKAANTPFYYRDLMQEIAKMKELTDEGVMQVIAQLYTEINIDGRFACVGTNLWGLKRWYPVDKSDDGVNNSKHPRIINDEDDDDDYFAEDEEPYAEEDGGYTSLDGEPAEEEEDFFENEVDEDPIVGEDIVDAGEEIEGLVDEDEEDSDFDDEDEDTDDADVTDAKDDK